MRFLLRQRVGLGVRPLQPRCAQARETEWSVSGDASLQLPRKVNVSLPRKGLNHKRFHAGDSRQARCIPDCRAARSQLGNLHRVIAEGQLPGPVSRGRRYLQRRQDHQFRRFVRSDCRESLLVERGRRSQFRVAGRVGGSDVTGCRGVVRVEMARVDAPPVGFEVEGPRTQRGPSCVRVIRGRWVPPRILNPGAVSSRSRPECRASAYDRPQPP